MIGQTAVATLGDRVEPRFLSAVGVCLYGAGTLLAIHAVTTQTMYTYAILMGAGFSTAFTCLQTVLSNYYGLKVYPALLGVTLPVGTILGAGTYDNNIVNASGGFIVGNAQTQTLGSATSTFLNQTGGVILVTGGTLNVNVGSWINQGTITNATGAVLNRVAAVGVLTNAGIIVNQGTIGVQVLVFKGETLGKGEQPAAPPPEPERKPATRKPGVRNAAAS